MLGAPMFIVLLLLVFFFLSFLRGGTYLEVVDLQHTMTHITIAKINIAYANLVAILRHFLQVESAGPKPCTHILRGTQKKSQFR